MTLFLSSANYYEVHRNNISNMHAITRHIPPSISHLIKQKLKLQCSLCNEIKIYKWRSWCVCCLCWDIKSRFVHHVGIDKSLDSPKYLIFTFFSPFFATYYYHTYIKYWNWIMIRLWYERLSVFCQNLD